MSYGYGVEFTPLQLLTIYNAVANEGDMVKPQVVEKIMDHGREVESFEPEIIKRGICSALINCKFSLKARYAAALRPTSMTKK